MGKKGGQNTLLKSISLDFFKNDVLEVAPLLLGKYLVRKFENGEIYKDVIVEVEAYRGEEDLACHASKGRTPRTEVMYKSGGHIYVYLIYGMYYMLNIVTGNENDPQAVLIRGTSKINGPGRITKTFKIDKSFNGKLLIPENNLWIEDSGKHYNYYTTTRIGVDYAKEWKYKPWRYVANGY
jgi:DNA-3-methyladenine glycosylase